MHAFHTNVSIVPFLLRRCPENISREILDDYDTLPVN